MWTKSSNNPVLKGSGLDLGCRKKGAQVLLRNILLFRRNEVGLQHVFPLYTIRI